MGIVSNPPPQLTYIELDGTVSHQQAANNAWEDWDLAASIPLGCRAVEVITQGSASTKGVRANGSALSRLITTYPFGIAAIPDASRIIETYANAGAWFYLVGYWT